MTTKKDTDTKSTPTTSDNKVIFAPLGKYAAIAVIMVSIIVTTAIMLDKQLNTVNEKIATIESEVTKSHSKDTTLTETTAVASTEPETLNETASANEKQQSSEVAIKPEIKKAATVDVYVTDETKTETTPEANNQTATASTLNTEEVAATENVYITDIVNKPEVTVTENAKQTNQAAYQTQTAMNHNDKAMGKTNFDQKRQAHAKAVKLEQKQRMTEMFARIKVLESQQLDHYKAGQEKQIARLRERIAEQQKMIDALVLRNKDLFELRAANIERRQTNREQMLNRI